MVKNSMFILFALCGGFAQASSNGSLNESKQGSAMAPAQTAAQAYALALRHAHFERVRAEHARIGDINAPYRAERLRQEQNAQAGNRGVWFYIKCCVSILNSAA